MDRATIPRRSASCARFPVARRRFDPGQAILSREDAEGLRGELDRTVQFCPRCHEAHRTAGLLAGTRVRCPCGEGLLVPRRLRIARPLGLPGVREFVAAAGAARFAETGGVWLDTDLARRVAVEVSPEGAQAEADFLERARLVAQLEHPAIQPVQTIEVGRDGLRSRSTPQARLFA